MTKCHRISYGERTFGKGGGGEKIMLTSISFVY